MMKKYIFGIILSIFVMNIVISQGTVAHAATTDYQMNTTTARESSITTVSKAVTNVGNEKTSNRAEFVQDRLPQTGVEANYSGIYFTIAGIFILLALFTSRSIFTKRNNTSDKQKK